jgi:hypothetical protein
VAQDLLLLLGRRLERIAARILCDFSLHRPIREPEA